MTGAPPLSTPLPHHSSRDGQFGIQIGSDWPPNGINLGLLKICFSTFWLAEPKCTETDLKKSQIYPIWGPIRPYLNTKFDIPDRYLELSQGCKLWLRVRCYLCTEQIADNPVQFRFPWFSLGSKKHGCLNWFVFQAGYIGTKWYKSGTL